MTKELWTSLFLGLAGMFLLWMYGGFGVLAGVFLFVWGNNMGRTYWRKREATHSNPVRGKIS